MHKAQIRPDLSDLKTEGTENNNDTLAHAGSLDSISGSRRNHFFRIQCNLCGNDFMARSRYRRFCRRCKESSLVYHYHEWMAA